MSEAIEFPANDALGIALAGAARGWRVTPVHHMVDAETCSCGNKCDPNSRGKHPRGAKWQERGATDQAQILRWAAQYPGTNWGFVTGPESGLFVLDVDKAKDGSPLGENTLAELEAEHGELPRTHMTVTGGDGLQYYFAYPKRPRKDGKLWGNSAKKLGPGLDTRGSNGMVVAAGSRSRKGEYTLLQDAPLAEIPEWVLEALEREPERKAAPPAAHLSVVRTSEGIHPWVKAVFKRQLAEFRALTTEDSGRTNLLTGRAKYLSQLANQPDTGLTEQEVRTALLEAAEANGFAAVKGLTYVETQIDRGITDGRIGEPKYWAEARDKVFTPGGVQMTDDDIRAWAEVYADEAGMLEELHAMAGPERVARVLGLEAPAKAAPAPKLAPVPPLKADEASTEAPAPSPEEPGDGERDEGIVRPQIVAKGPHLREVKREVWAALKVAELRDPKLFIHGDELAVAGPGELQPLGTASLAAELSERIDFVCATTASRNKRQKAVEDNKKAEEEGKQLKDVPDLEYAPTDPPQLIVKGIMEAPKLVGLSEIRRVSRTPYFSPSGRLVTKPGYDRESKILYIPVKGVEIPTISEKPGYEEVRKALDLLALMYHDFCFTSDAERAGVYALGVTCFLRPMIDGPSPIFAFDAPNNREGKGLLMSCTVRPVYGEDFELESAPTEPAEWEKKIIANRRTGSALAIFDNLSTKADSGALASASTSWPFYGGRILGKSETAKKLPAPAAWVITGKNITGSTEITERLIRIRIDSGLEHPGRRTGFKIPNLAGWVTKHQGELVWAWLTLIADWVANGQPEANTPAFGSFEKWVEVVGSVLAWHGIHGLLDNRDELAETADEEGSAMRGFIAGWIAEDGGKARTLAGLIDLITGWEEATKEQGGGISLGKLSPTDVPHFSKVDAPIDLGGGALHSQAVKLGREMKKHVGRRFGDHVLCHKRPQGKSWYWLEKISD